jgi:Domain of unknown function (DUF4340)
VRGLKSFLLLVVIALGLGAYLYFVESKRQPGDADKKDKVFSVEADKIDEIAIKSELGERTTLRKNGNDWQIVQPMATASDGAAVSSITSNLSTLEIQRVIDENPGDLKEFGLEPARIEVTFKSGGKEQRLSLGRKTPPATDLYAKLADQKRVFLVPSYVESTFNKSTFDLRDKSALKFDRDKVDTMAISTPKRTLSFTKANGEWQMTAPLHARADFTTVDGLVSRLNGLQMKAIVAPEAAQLGDYGLDKPEVSVELGAGSSKATLAIGKAAGEGAVNAKDGSRPAVFTVDSSLVADMTKDAGDYRQKDLFDARAFNSTRVEVVRAGQTLTFEKTKTKNKEGQDEEKWRQIAPAARDIDQTKVDNLLSAVTATRANSFIDSAARQEKTGLDKPEIVVTIKSDEGKREEKVTFAKSGTDAYASRAGEPGVAKVDASAVDNIVKSVEALK